MVVIWPLLLLLWFWTPPACLLQSPSSCSGSDSLEELKLEIARLESILENRIEEINSKIQYFRDLEKKTEELNSRIDSQTALLSAFENDDSIMREKIVALEEEIKLLWTASRKNNFQVHSLESKAEDAEKRLKKVSSKLEQMSEIVTEQWMQIQKLEQALYMAELRTWKAKIQYWRKCPFVSLVVDLYSECRKAAKEIRVKYESLTARSKLRASPAFATAEYYHHQLQSLVRRAMQASEMTAALAHEEVVFFIASAAAVVFPLVMVGACMALLGSNPLRR